MFRQHRRKQGYSGWNQWILLGILTLGVWRQGSGAIAQPTPLTAPQVAAQMTTLPTWRTDGQQLACTYEFANFVAAIAFLNALVEPAETLGHHPDLRVSYNRVGVVLTTHDAGGLTALDFALAEQIAATAAPQLCSP